MSRWGHFKRKIMKVLYPGSFNPWHNGHQHVYDEACQIFGKENVIIGIANNKSKSNNVIFTKWCMNTLDNVVIINGLVADYCKENNISKIIRGVRQGYDLELEEKLSHWNYELGGVRSIYIPTPSESTFVSSSFLREIKSYRDFNYLKTYIPKHICGRWTYNTKIPNSIIYYGQSCVGKSTALKKMYEYDEVVNCDTKIWETVNWSVSQVDDFKKEMKQIISHKEHLLYNSDIRKLAQALDWSKLFDNHFSVFDFPVIGTYFQFLPLEIKYQYQYIKFETSDEQRLKNMKKRKVSKKWIQCLDEFYCEPVFCDDVVSL